MATVTLNEGSDTGPERDHSPFMLGVTCFYTCQSKEHKALSLHSYVFACCRCKTQFQGFVGILNLLFKLSLHVLCPVFYHFKNDLSE